MECKITAKGLNLGMDEKDATTFLLLRAYHANGN
jgi:hypothetical protein